MAARDGEASSVTEQVDAEYLNAGEGLAGHAPVGAAAAPRCCHPDPRARRRCSVPRGIRTPGTPGPAAGCRQIQVHPARRREAAGPWSRPGQIGPRRRAPHAGKAATVFQRGPGRDHGRDRPGRHPARPAHDLPARRSTISRREPGGPDGNADL